MELSNLLSRWSVFERFLSKSMPLRLSSSLTPQMKGLCEIEPRQIKLPSAMVGNMTTRVAEGQAYLNRLEVIHVVLQLVIQFVL
ncbi:hypothetical protein QJS10_CPB19g00831 [Acorus calamus]|uniref:Uncharacterized protein n=1 Tax=Acorus calamus TaxID=4465 RepID=A0AAV9CE32_ACOCL|nr:hypothetical protein QJS10_CPB19g00831 [Acorus calamus]